VTHVHINPLLFGIGIGYRFGGGAVAAPAEAAPPPAPEVILKGVNFENDSAKLTAPAGQRSAVQCSHGTQSRQPRDFVPCSNQGLSGPQRATVRLEMNRRFLAASLAAFSLLTCATQVALGGGVASLTSADAAGGIKAALSQGINTAVGELGAPDGFLKNPKVTIPLPPALQKAEQGLRVFGMGADADALKNGMNHAAENAMHEALPVLKNALHSMSLEDAKGILTGGNDAATAYFRRTTSAELTTRFKPIVARATARLKLADLYNRYAGQAAKFGLLKSQDADVDDYVTAKALDGLFLEMAVEEQAIRKDPLGQTSSLIKKVFGSL